MNTTKTVYVLDKAKNEIWTDKEISHLCEEYMVEIERLPAFPFRAVAMNAPHNGKPIYLTWRADCMLQEVDYKDRWTVDGYLAEKRYDGIIGSWITDLIKRMIALMAGRLGTVAAELNGVEVVVKDGDTVEERHTWMQAEQERKHQAYLASPECAERNRLAQIAHDKKVAEMKAAFEIAPERMSLRDPEEWKKCVEANSDGYGSATARYAEKWARIMEGWMSKGLTVAECADKASQLADDEGITGFMYNCAVSMLSGVWEHGEALRLWHNKKSQIGTEGDKANDTGGVLNTSLLSVG